MHDPYSISLPAIVSISRPPSRTKNRGPRKGNKAKCLTDSELIGVLSYVQRNRRYPETDIVKILLSFRAGLRACEIADLHVFDVTSADGSTADVITIRPDVAKGGRGRIVPMNAELKQAIDRFRARYPRTEWLAVSQVWSKVRKQNANCVTAWFHRLYRECGLEGCSSHSGRRTFITWACRNIPPNCSLRDIQVMVGHERLDTTQSYIDCSPDVRGFVNNMTPLLFESGEGASE